MTTPFQPTLPAENSWTDAELAFVDDSPPRLFPENQNSNFGLIRKIFADRVQELIEQQNTIYNERFVNTSTAYIDEWERTVGLPVAPTNRTMPQRRSDILGRLSRGPFTRSRRAATVDKFIVASFGAPIQLTPAGVPLVAAGVPIYGEVVVGPGYAIVENIPGFSYDVRVLNTLSIDITGLTRELTRITPAGYTFTITIVTSLP